MASRHTASHNTAAARPQRRRYRRADQIVGVAFVAPLALHTLIFFVAPLIAAFYYSLTEWDMRTPPVFVGLQNYQQLFFDRLRFPYFWHALGVSVYYTMLAVPLTLVTALTLALMVSNLRRGQQIFRAAFYLPVITAEVAVGTLWRWIYDSLYGLLNLVLGMFGVPPINWLGTPRLIIPALAIIAAWQCGGAFLIFLAGLKGIAGEYYEAAALDGASDWQKFRFITLPLLRPTTFFLIVTGVIGAIQVFGLVYVLIGIGGGPRQAGLTYLVYLYDQAFTYFQMGPASAMSIVLFVILMIVTFFQFRVLPQNYD
jgi:multiple sugar transport system permease protein